MFLIYLFFIFNFNLYVIRIEQMCELHTSQHLEPSEVHVAINVYLNLLPFLFFKPLMV